MRKPKAIQIMGQWFTIEYHDDEFELDGDLCMGSLEFESRKIDIVADRNWRLHLWHECLHAALQMAGLDHVLKENEEAVVRSIEHAMGPLVQFHFKNKRFKY